MNDKKLPHSSKLFPIALFVIAGIALCVVGIMAYIGVQNSSDFKDMGPWGDFFGGTLNPILTTFTFFAVLTTVYLQVKELALTRRELERSADALEKQIAASDRQIFENAFFQMLNLHNNIVNSIDLTDQNGQSVRGRDCFRRFYSDLRRYYSNEVSRDKKRAQDTNSEPESDEILLDTAYKRFWEGAQVDLGHYFRYLFNVIRFIDNNKVSDDFHIKLLRSQLSDQELGLLFYNALSAQGAAFRPYIERFALFDNMPMKWLFNKRHEQRFPPTAYGKG
jgi:hypothetical protein